MTLGQQRPWSHRLRRATVRIPAAHMPIKRLWLDMPIIPLARCSVDLLAIS
ncbi:MAG: hypothetical protein AAF539_14810 [Planctomycetota bacterium]